MDRQQDSLDKKSDDGTRITEVNSNVSSEAGDENRTLWQNVKKYRKVSWITLALTSAILLYGYDNVVVGTVSGMKKFQVLGHVRAHVNFVIVTWARGESNPWFNLSALSQRFVVMLLQLVTNPRLIVCRQDFGELYDDKGETDPDLQEWILPSQWLALWNFASPIGAMLGSIFGGWFQDRVGRRMALAVSSFLSALAVAIMYVSYLPEDIDGRRGCFFAGKLFQGASIGAVMAATQTYMSEILPPALRGSGMAFFPAFTLVGQLTGALVIYGSLGADKGYITAFYSQWPFSFVPVVVAIMIPESPAWYIRKDQVEKAFKAQARLDPSGTDTRAVIEKLQADIEHEKQEGKSTYMECFHRRNIRRTLIVMWANSLPSVFGLQLLAKASYFLQIVGMDEGPSIIFLILGIVLGLLANIVSIWLIARVGRRPLILISLGISSLLWLSMGIANCFKVTSPVVWWTAVSMMITIVVCGMGVWPCSFTVAAETSALQLRAKTQGIGWCVSAFTTAVSGVVLPYIFNPDEGNLRGKTGFTYVGASLAGLAVSWFLVPEMKGRTVGEIDRMFELGLPARQFRHWRDARPDVS
ncbi:MFS general substrate transporter [Corynespora cassiicola Philippines]|uniref:MFS general substrate transporter n=1 Tax=Corynespora cassiicola Philippines TaxID=1448308 RepID=A0A2T2P931_CORCC|nr:MFS general substrate transporter [Corynespora cassiicola Philippines]